MRPTAQQFYRDPATPWAELRVTQHSPHCYRLHMHAEYSVGIVDAGHAVFQHRDGPERIGPGRVILIEPGHWHACNPDPACHWSYRMLFVQADWLHAALGVNGLHFPHRALQHAGASAVVNRLCQPQGAAHVHGDGELLLLHFLKQHALAGGAQLAQLAQLAEVTHPPGHESVIHTALARLHQHPEADTSVQAMAADAQMTPPRFIHHFKAATGVTPGAYRMNVRLNGARQLLAEGVALADAAHCMGFADQAHLQRAFKAHHALTPGTYARPRMRRV